MASKKDTSAWDTLADMPGPNPCWFHPFLGWLWTALVGAYIELAGHYPWVAVAAVGACSAPAAFFVARKLVRGKHQAFEAPRGQAGQLAVAGWLVMTGWAAWSATRHVLAPVSWSAIGVLTFAWLIVGVFYTHMRCTLVEAHELVDTAVAGAAKVTASLAEQAPTAGSATQLSSLAGAMLAILRECGFGTCSVVSETEKRFGPELTLQLDPKRADSFATVKASRGKIVGLATRRLRALGMEIADDTIEFVKAGAADMVAVRFRLHQPPEVIPVRPHTGPATINEPLWLGLWDDGEDILVDIRYRHGKNIGGTDSGKTTLENMILYGITGTIDCIPWVCAMSKGLDLAGPWLQPLSDGRAEYPVLDYVESQDWDAVSRMLRVAYCTVLIRERAPRAQFQRDRNRVLPTPDHPLIYLVIEESDVIMKDPRLIAMPDGRKMTAANVILYLVSKGRQYAVQVELLNQGVTQQQMGNMAGAIKLNVTRTIVFWTPKKAYGQWALPDGCGLDTTLLPPHTFYMTNGKNAQPRQGKAAYIDEEVAIPEAAIQHQTWMTTLEPYTQRKLREMVGDDYAGRWSYERTQIWRDYFGEFPHLPTPARESVSTAGTRGESPSPKSPPRKGTPTVRDGKPGWEYPGGFFVPDLSKSGTAAPAGGDDIDDELGDIPPEWRGAFDAIQSLDAQEPVRPARPESLAARKPIPEPLASLLVALVDDERDFIPIDELAQLTRMEAGELGSKLTELGVPSERRGTNRTRGRSLAKMRIVAVCHSTGHPLPTSEPDEE
jgi:hypothetical protein